MFDSVDADVWQLITNIIDDKNAKFSFCPLILLPGASGKYILCST